MSLINPVTPLVRREREGVIQPEGPVQKPVYQVNETDEAYRLVVQLPGVDKKGLEVTSDNGEIRIVGQRAWKRPEGWTTLHCESDDSTYELVLTHDNVVNHDKIVAELLDGVLTVTLPKAEAIKPRKITIK